MNTFIRLSVVILLALLIGACTKGGIYEGIRFKSNQDNAQDPNYNPDSVPSYEEYRIQREQYLEDLAEKQGN